MKSKEKILKIYNVACDECNSIDFKALFEVIVDYLQNKKNKGKDKSKEDKLIFPRFHQLDCVNMLLSEAQPGQNYLIQHSAGSGKTKTIAWLADGLKNLFDENGKRIYDMIIRRPSSWASVL